MSKIKFGFMGLGNMAHKIAKALEVVENGQLVAAGSRTRDKALQFGEQYGLEKNRCYGSYEKLADDESVNVIYVATPVGLHKEHSLMCLKKGKNVLCEKSLAETAQDAKVMIEKSRETGNFFMEAMWTRFLPIYKNIKFWLDNNRIGEIQAVEADICISHRLDSNDIRLDPELGGGALLDLGIYPVSLFSYILKEQPKNIKSVVKMGDSGVDRQVAASFSYNGQATGSMYCSLFAKSPDKAIIVGTKGRIEITNFFYSEKAQLIVDEHQEEIINRPHKVNGYEYELEEVVNCLQQGKKESDVISRQESVEIMETMDRIRENW